jgi:hypothetical protein
MKTREEAEKEREAYRQSLPLRREIFTIEACLVQLIKTLVAKQTLDAQEVLDAFDALSDEALFHPDGAVSVQTIERICKEISTLPGVKRPSA